MNQPERQPGGETETRGGHHSRILQVLRYISDNLEEGLELPQLADVACYSPYHFHRIFTAIVGEPVATYVRRKRLEKAAREIIQSKQSITAIALSAGFETPTAFTKAFKRTFYITPSYLREVGHLSPISHSIQPLSIKLPEVVMTPEIRELGSFPVVLATGRGLINHTFTQAAQKAFSELQHYCVKHQLWPITGRCLAIMPDDPSTTPLEDCRFQAALELKEERVIPKEGTVERGLVEAGRCAIFVHLGSYDRLWETWNAAYRNWLPASGEELRHAPPFEVYLNDPSNTAPEDLVTEICIPI